MNYSATFNGWFGKIAKEFTYETLEKVGQSLAAYYKAHSTPGQKLMVGYDTRFFAKEFAEHLACIMAENGVKVFLSNRFCPSSVLVVASMHKKSMGAVMLTGDEHPASFIGIRAYNEGGFLMNDEDLSPFSSLVKEKNINPNFKKWMNKGFIEPFDPTIAYIQHIEQRVDFEKIGASNRILFNPLFGSGSLYFDHLLSDKNIRGYTIDHEASPHLNGINPEPSQFTKQLYDDMVFHGADLGFIVSPDCSSFHFLIEPHQLSISELLYFYAELFHSKKKTGKILLVESTNVNTSLVEKLGFEVVFVKEEKFQSSLRGKDYLIAVDTLNRFYFENHGAADALLCGYYLVEVLNNKELTPKMMHQKLSRFKGSV